MFEEKEAAGGWGSVRGMAEVMGRERPEPAVLATLRSLNKPKGVMCTSCAWPKPANYKAFEFCENGAKATIWEATTARCAPDFWNDHTVAELRAWSDHDLEMTGRLTHPLKYDSGSDRYVAVSWEEAFADIGAKLARVDPKQAVFYASGHAGLEASFLFALFARLFGTNNLPQSSNMCHETTSVGLKKVIGSPVGTVVWDDLEKADAFFFFGQNTGVCSPRFLHPLAAAKKRGAKIVTFNPVREAGLVAFVDPTSPVDMATGRETIISDQYWQLKPGSDVAAIIGLCKHVIERDDEARAAGAARILDVDFIAQNTTGFDDMAAAVRATGWDEIESATGLAEKDIRSAAEIYIQSERVIGVYGMGLTQHNLGSLNIGMYVDFLLLRGNIGRPGTGCCPVRGHSNVQGQRTVGITEKSELAPNDALRRLFGFEPPQEDGMVIVEAAEAMIEGKVKAMICLGGNLVRALPDRERVEKAWESLDLAVMISTKLNRSHLHPGKAAYILPCLGRAEQDIQATGPQAISIEDSFSCIHGSQGLRAPASETLKSEVAIVAGLAKATLPPNPKVKWDEWTGDYALVRDLIEQCYPDEFRDFNARLFEPGGFWRGNAAAGRVWKTESGKAEFTTPDRLDSLGFTKPPGTFVLFTLRSNDQFNTTVYGYSDRFRGVEGTRDVILMNPKDMEEAGIAEDRPLRVTTAIDDGVERVLTGFRARAFDLPRGAVAGYYPECNVLMALGCHDRLSKTPSYKSLPVRIEAA